MTWGGKVGSKLEETDKELLWKTKIDGDTVIR
jgi:hypothetical protein